MKDMYRWTDQRSPVFFSYFNFNHSLDILTLLCLLLTLLGLLLTTYPHHHLAISSLTDTLHTCQHSLRLQTLIDVIPTMNSLPSDVQFELTSSNLNSLPSDVQLHITWNCTSLGSEFIVGITSDKV